MTALFLERRAGRIENGSHLHQQYLWLEEDGRVSVRKADWFPARGKRKLAAVYRTGL